MICLKILIFLTLVLPCSFESIRTLSTKSFCTLTGEDCIENKCNYYEKCPLPFIYKCGQNQCARNVTACLLYLSTQSHFKSRLFKTNALKKKKTKFDKFNTRIANCKHPAYIWNSSDVCLQAKVCYERVKIPSLSVIHWIFESAKYQLVKIDCPCDLKHNYKCQNEFCTTSKRACNVFIEKKQQEIKPGIQSCQ